VQIRVGIYIGKVCPAMRWKEPIGRFDGCMSQCQRMCRWGWLQEIVVPFYYFAFQVLVVMNQDHGVVLKRSSPVCARLPMISTSLCYMNGIDEIPSAHVKTLSTLVELHTHALLLRYSLLWNAKVLMIEGRIVTGVCSSSL